MFFPLLDKNNRLRFCQETTNNENRIRKEKSLKDYDVLNDNLFDYVKQYLLSQFSEQTVLEMPIVSSINIAKRVATKEASIYKSCPDRKWTNLTDDQLKELQALYEDSGIDQKLFKSNLYFKAQQQNTLMVVPKDGKLKVRVLMNHHFDVIPDQENPEIAESYILSTMDKTFVPYISDRMDEMIADQDDWRATVRRYIAWDEENNFTFNGKGEITSEVLPNPLAQFGMMPFIDIAYEKDFEFFVRAGQSLADFAVQYCAVMSDMYNIMKMQGFAVAYLKGPKEIMPQNLKIGPNLLLRLPTDETTHGQTEFGFASPNSDIAGSLQFMEVLLSNFLTSRGLDASAINGKMQSQKFSSGLERLLSMIENFEATAADYNLYEKVEDKLFNLIKKWSQITYGTDQAFLSFAIPEECELNIEFDEPEMVSSEKEKLDVIQQKIELGLMNQKMAVMDLYGVDSDKADEMLLDLGAVILTGRISNYIANDANPTDVPDAIASAPSSSPVIPVSSTPPPLIPNASKTKA